MSSLHHVVEPASSDPSYVNRELGTPVANHRPATRSTTTMNTTTSTSSSDNNNNNNNNNNPRTKKKKHSKPTIPLSRDVVDNPMPHLLQEGENATPLEVSGSTATDKLAIIMVGLPATGKTHYAKRICRFLSFFHDIPAQIFNVGDYRRQLCGAQMPASFYDPSNRQALCARLMACNAALADMMDYLRQDGVRVAVFDATNSTQERRRHILRTLDESGIGAKKMFCESCCDSPDLQRDNILKVKLSTPDYRGMNAQEAMSDFLLRIEQYKSVYVPVDETVDGYTSYVKIINSRKFIANNIRGYLKLKVVHFVMNLHTLPRTFYLTRHGQSEYNLLGKIGGDSGLSENGREYAKRLAVFARDVIATKRTTTTVVRDDDGSTEEDVVEVEEDVPARLWTSTLRRTKETAQFIAHPHIQHTWDNGETGEWVQFRPMARRNLDELYAGVCDGMTYQEIASVYPEEFKRRQDDKLAYRYPRGESYMDVTLRLEPVAQEMERTREPVLIIAHQGILRILYAYFMGLDRKDAPYVSIPLNNVIQLTPHAYGCEERRFCLMNKEEMLNDGQDEPITSMPTAASSGNDGPGAATASMTTTTTTRSSSFKSTTSSTSSTSSSDMTSRELKTQYSATDPVMNPSSC